VAAAPRGFTPAAIFVRLAPRPGRGPGGAPEHHEPGEIMRIAAALFHDVTTPYSTRVIVF